jgi:hypothetical protein
MTAALSLFPIGTSGGANGETNETEPPPGEDWIKISTPQELAMVGSTGESSGEFPLNGKYYLSNDIIFGISDDTNGGIGIRMSVVVSGADMTITITPDEGQVSSLNAWAGMVYNDSDSNTVNLSGISELSVGVHVLAIGGMIGTEPFAYSMEVDTGSSDEQTAEFNSNGNFSPIGMPSAKFKGTFNGNGHKISGMHAAVFNGTESAYSGMFGYTEGALISDLGIVDGSVTSVASTDSYKFAYAGGIVGFAVGLSGTPSIANCYNTSTVTAASLSFLKQTSACAGGIVGNLFSLPIADCYNTGSVTAMSASVKMSSSTFAGGIAGVSDSPMTDCYNTGTVTAISTPAENSTAAAIAGGIAGNAGPIEGCYNTGAVIARVSPSSGGYSYAGGIAGNLYLFSKSITDCYNTGPVTATFSSSSSGSADSSAGGIVGFVSTVASITKCYNTAPVTAMLSSPSSADTDAFAGGIAGNVSTQPVQSIEYRITDCYNTGSVKASVSLSDEYSDTSVKVHTGGITGSISLPQKQEYYPPYWEHLRTSAITNCYNTGKVAAELLRSDEYVASAKLYAGSIAGSIFLPEPQSKMIIASMITNCYFLKGQLTVNGTDVADAVTGEGESTVDGNADGKPREGSKGSGAKETEQLRPSLNAAKIGESIFFIDPTEINSVDVDGWNFNDVWTIDLVENDGYPILRPISGSIDIIAIPSKTSYNEGDALDLQGLIVEISYPDKPPRQITDFTDVAGFATDPLEGAALITLGTVIVAVSYEEEGVIRTTSFDITVAAKYNVELVEGAGYVLSPSDGYSSPVASGDSFMFTLEMLPGYTRSLPVVKANGVPIEPVDGIYAVSNIVSDTTITVEGVALNKYRVSTPSGTGYTVNATDPSMVEHNGTFTFAVDLDPEYDRSPPMVKANGKLLNSSNGIYRIGNITSNVMVTVEGVIPNTYDVSLPSGSGFTAKPADGYSKNVQHGGSFVFSVVLDDPYMEADVIVNTTLLENVNGFYTLENITGDIEIMIGGLHRNETWGEGENKHPAFLTTAIALMVIAAAALAIFFFVIAKRRKEEEEK